MNIQLVEFLVQIIQALAPEERQLLEERLHCGGDGLEPTVGYRQAAYKQVQAIRSRIFARRSNQQLEPTAAELIQWLREERSEQLLRSSFPEQSIRSSL